ncbi:MAG: 3-deoxy-7-phosphoheptulonate synthase [Chloroflexi bacterium]|jgi:3-deoxy-7-phosphoheptulonate synthase|nr:3-deoxy-7-phosphoheptulonate synthase [Chloroflexota bacterium]MBT4074074.1 3-deoxy-7-phosphoheptulonate synthase [Chloroflexota bacterium]MBT4514075.1 3-deoxy-7-phosphoheptulonate synthase [Chloroflexota bacterium]MBT6681875.1 3-deoxy-7-phosphoheptulonate synthase [Chloroflexota bacterium]
MTTSNVNVERMDRLGAPDDYITELPITPEATALVAKSRQELQDILAGKDDRMAMLVGPCSIHDEKAGLEYAQNLAELANKVSDQILVVMRVYFEKPRTTVGWKGLINDPNLNGTFDVATGLRRGRKFLLQVAELGLPAGTEFLDPFTPQYLADLVSWGAIGARTTESQTHRQMASGLSMPIGFKNGTGGTLQIAVDAMVAAESPHAFLGVDGEGRASVVHTSGNVGGHLILRGGADGPNYDAESVARATKLLGTGGVSQRLVVDCSHANSNKDHNRQPIVFRDVIEQRARGNGNVAGIMLESHLNPGAQKLVNGLEGLEYGVSITDACIDWGTTEELLLEAHGVLSGKVGASA